MTTEFEKDTAINLASDLADLEQILNKTPLERADLAEATAGIAVLNATRIPRDTENYEQFQKLSGVYKAKLEAYNTGKTQTNPKKRTPPPIPRKKVIPSKTRTFKSHSKWEKSKNVALVALVTAGVIGHFSQIKKGAEYLYTGVKNGIVEIADAIPSVTLTIGEDDKQALLDNLQNGHIQNLYNSTHNLSDSTNSLSKLVQDNSVKLGTASERNETQSGQIKSLANAITDFKKSQQYTVQSAMNTDSKISANGDEILQLQIDDIVSNDIDYRKAGNTKTILPNTDYSFMEDVFEKGYLADIANNHDARWNTSTRVVAGENVLYPSPDMPNNWISNTEARKIYERVKKVHDFNGNWVQENANAIESEYQMLRGIISNELKPGQTIEEYNAYFTEKEGVSLDDLARMAVYMRSGDKNE